MDWYDETLSSVGINPESATGPTSDMSNDDIMESIGLALGDGASQPWVQSFIEYGRDGGPSTGVYGPKAVNAGDSKKEEGLISKVSSWVEKNKGLSEMLAKGIAGAALGNQNKKAAEIQAQSRLDELKLKNQQEMEKDARTSASVSGLRVPGLIGRAQPLRRADGSMVYQNGRIV